MTITFENVKLLPDVYEQNSKPSQNICLWYSLTFWLVIMNLVKNNPIQDSFFLILNSGQIQISFYERRLLVTSQYIR